MFGWIILFALIMVAGAVQAFTGYGAGAAKFASTVFAFLLLIAVVARAARGRAW